MAKVTAPLLSLAATGSIARRITFRTLAGRSIASRWTAPTTPPSTYQVEDRQRAADAAAAWAQASTKDRNAWRAAATAARLPVYAIYMREYILQRCAPDTQPLIPETYP
jgi:hypothetical protein